MVPRVNAPYPPDGPPTVSAVIVNYNSWPDTERLVGTLAPHASGRLDVWVVDNASASPPPDSSSLYRQSVHLVLRPINGGFAAGVNAGWRASAGRWLLVLNPDILPLGDFLPGVLDRVTRADEIWGPRAGIIGFGLREPSGARQPSIGPFPSLPRVIREAFLPRARRKYLPDRKVRPGPVPWATGACLLIRRTLMEELGGLDEDFFLYHEEVDLCRSAWDRGWQVVYDPSLECQHANPLQNRRPTPLLRILTRHGKLLYFRKHLPRWQLHALARIAEWDAGARRLVARDPEEARAWRAVAEIARKMRGPRANLPLGIQVLELARNALAPVSVTASCGEEALPADHQSGGLGADASARRRAIAHDGEGAGRGGHDAHAHGGVRPLRADRPDLGR